MPRERKGVNSRTSKTDETRKYFVVASEGADTERIYFEALRDGLIGQGSVAFEKAHEPRLLGISD